MAFPNYGRLYLRSYGEKPDSAVLRTEMETGPAKQAQVRSRSKVSRSLTIFFTGAEFAAFKTWFTGAECNRGASWFDWTDPQDGTIKQARIVGGDYDAKTSSEGEGAEIAWELSLTLESWE